jgi:AcrR family transcriptional regulator
MPKVSDSYKEERRQAILETALTVFAEKGYRGTTVDEIARRLQVSKGSVYLYFSGKDDIYARLMEERMERTVERLKASFTGVTGAADKLRLVIAAFRGQKLEELRQLLAFYLEFWLESSRREELKQVMGRQAETAVAFLRDIVEEGKRSGEFRPDANANVAASLFWAARDGIALQFVGGGEETGYHRLMAEMEEMMFRYLRNV